jgi:serine/threonine protein phosphatase PrpC
VTLLTIGAFARAAGLTPKALRLYDGLGVLPPAAVDAESGYRYYHPAQLDRARLVAALRRAGMPLARIRAICDKSPAEAAADVAAYWAEAEADHATRGRLAALLVDALSGRKNDMPDLQIRAAARTDAGRDRTTNEDVAHAGTTVFAVADGTRGPGGADASAAAVRALTPSADLADLADLAEAAHRADLAVHTLAQDLDPDDERPATTLTALLWSPPRLGLVHIGDTRAYLLRHGDLFRLTQDHSHVQTLVDAGRIGAGEASSHPQRPLLVRALGAGPGRCEPDVSVRTALAGDRYLLCSDGLWAAAPPAEVAETLPGGTPDEAVHRLIDLAYRHGAPDNIAAVVVDVEPSS